MLHQADASLSCLALLSASGVLPVGVSHWQYTTVPQDLLRERLALGL